jgi:hypothetical protein
MGLVTLTRYAPLGLPAGGPIAAPGGRCTREVIYMTTIETGRSTLPTPDELELAMFKLSSFGSDLDSFESLVRHYTDTADAQPADRDAAAHILAFAVDVRDSLADMLKDIEKLEKYALSAYQDAIDGREYWERVTAGTIEDLNRLQQMRDDA